MFHPIKSKFIVTYNLLQMSKHQNEGSTQHSFSTILSSLASTKRQIMELQISISNVVQSMNKIDNYLASQRNSSLVFEHRHPSIIRNERNQTQMRQMNSHSDSTDNYLNMTIKIDSFSYKQSLVYKCIRCSRYFSTEDLLAVHIRNNHHFCRLCQSFYDEAKQTHIKQYCQQQRLSCMGCSAKVKRRNLHKHTEQCCYKMCFKCKQAIYVKAYGYHMQKCKIIKGFITKCKQLPIHQNAMQNNQGKQSFRAQKLHQKPNQPQISLCSVRMAC